MHVRTLYVRALKSNVIKFVTMVTPNGIGGFVR